MIKMMLVVGMAVSTLNCNGKENIKKSGEVFVSE